MERDEEEVVSGVGNLDISERAPSYAEKKQLTDQIKTLQSSDLHGLVEILMNEIRSDTPGEICFDLDNLSTQTYRKIEDYVKSKLR